MNRRDIGKLLYSRNRKTQMLGGLAALCIFLPDVFRVAGDDSLTVWQRLEVLTLSAGQMVGAVALAAQDWANDENGDDQA